jgi:hypothetical protein
VAGEWERLETGSRWPAERGSKRKTYAVLVVLVVSLSEDLGGFFRKLPIIWTKNKSSPTRNTISLS